MESRWVGVAQGRRRMPHSLALVPPVLPSSFGARASFLRVQPPPPPPPPPPMLDDGPLLSPPSFPSSLVDMPSELATAEIAAKGPTAADLLRGCSVVHHSLRPLPPLGIAPPQNRESGGPIRIVLPQSGQAATEQRQRIGVAESGHFECVHARARGRCGTRPFPPFIRRPNFPHCRYCSFYCGADATSTGVRYLK